MGRQYRLIAAALATLLLGSLACSPEASRSRGGGPGADVGNRGSTVELHGGKPPDSMFYQTPLGPAAQKQR